MRLAALAGRSSPQRASTIEYVDTTRLGSISNIASRARCLVLPTFRRRSPATTSKVPRRWNSGVPSSLPGGIVPADLLVDHHKTSPSLGDRPARRDLNPSARACKRASRMLQGPRFTLTSMPRFAFLKRSDRSASSGRTGNTEAVVPSDHFARSTRGRRAVRDGSSPWKSRTPQQLRQVPTNLGAQAT
jgi:hypothetical protein